MGERDDLLDRREPELEVVRARVQLEAVRAALGALPEAQRQAVVLAYWGGLTAGEIADRAGVPIGTAKSRVRLGLQRMRAELGEPAVAEAA